MSQYEIATRSAPLPDVLPSVSYDVDFRGIPQNFDLDLHYLADYLRGRGLDDEQIEGVGVEFSARVSLENLDTTAGLKGRYMTESHRCVVFLSNIGIMVANAAKELDKSPDWAVKMTHGIVADTLAHELEHYVSHAERGFTDDEEEYTNWRPDGDNTAYFEQPEEVRARAAEGQFDPSRLLLS